MAGPARLLRREAAQVTQMGDALVTLRQSRQGVQRRLEQVPGVGSW